MDQNGRRTYSQQSLNQNWHAGTPCAYTDLKTISVAVRNTPAIFSKGIYYIGKLFL